MYYGKADMPVHIQNPKEHNIYSQDIFLIFEGELHWDYTHIGVGLSALSFGVYSSLLQLNYS